MLIITVNVLKYFEHKPFEQYFKNYLLTLQKGLLALNLTTCRPSHIWLNQVGKDLIAITQHEMLSA